MLSCRNVIAFAIAASCTAVPFAATAELVYVTQWGSDGNGLTQFHYPTGMAIGPSGDVFVTDGGNHRVCRYTPDGQIVMTFGGLGNGPGKLNTPDFLAFSPTNGDLYIADKLNHRIQRFTEAGAFVQAWGSLGPGPGQFNAPWGVHVDADGYVFVTSLNQDRVQKFTEDAT